MTESLSLTPEGREAIRAARAAVRERLGAAVIRQHGAEVLEVDAEPSTARVRLAIVVEVTVLLNPQEQARRAHELDQVREALGAAAPVPER